MGGALFRGTGLGRAAVTAVLVIAALLLVACGPRVPDVLGMTVEQARQKLADSGLQVGRVTYDARARMATGAIKSQVPAAGSSAKPGQRVEIVIAGPPPATVPNLVGLVRARAEVSLAAIGLRSAVASSVVSQDVPESGVVSQSPAPGTSLPQNAVVLITLSTGKGSVPLPKVVGKTESVAKRELSQAGFVVRIASRDFDATKAGTILQQNPIGADARFGSAVNIVVSKGPKPPQVFTPQKGSSLRQALLDATRAYENYDGDYVVVELHVLGNWAVGTLRMADLPESYGTSQYAWHRKSGSWNHVLTGDVGETSHWKGMIRQAWADWGVPEGLIDAFQFK